MSITTATLLMTHNNNNMNSSTPQTVQSRLMDSLQIKILFGLIMALLCLVTIIGNICVIVKYRKTFFVSISSSFFFIV
jgi:hypothetical protein